MEARTSANERDRIEVLRRLEILDTPGEPEFDAIVELVATVCEVPVALVSLVDVERLWFKARVGMDHAEVTRDRSFCDQAIQWPDRLLVVPDTLADPLFAASPFVVGAPRIRSYAGMPIVVDGVALGTVCAIDTVPRDLTPHQLGSLEIAARAIAALARQRHGVLVEKALRLETSLRERAETRLRFSISHDGLTMVSNRAALYERLEDGLGDPDFVERGVPFTVCVVDLDGFKDVNESLSDEAGDFVLAETALRLIDACRAGDFVARLGADEFAVVLFGIGDGAFADRITARIVTELAQPFRFRDVDIHVTASVGLAFAEPHSRPGDLVTNAGIAMLEAKGRGRSAVQIFTEPLRTRSGADAALRFALQRGIQDGEFRLVFQPIVTLPAGKLEGFEALLRWNRPHLGEQRPDEFVAAAEENGLIVPLGEWVMRSACAMLRRWQGASERRLSLSVNVSSRQLLFGGFGESVERIVMETGVDPSRISLEITETAMMRDVAAASNTLYRLRELGMRVDLDDFGTGHSSLARLRALPIDRLKIDRAFVSGRGTELADPAIVRAIVGLAHEFGIGVIAEGVETPEQREALIAAECDAAQGYYFGRPMSPEAVEQLYFDARTSSVDPPAVARIRRSG